MPGGKTKFNVSWGLKDDANNDKINTWCQAGSTPYNAYCNYCKKEVSVDNSGLAQLVQHSKTTKHKDARKILVNPAQSKLSVGKPEPSTSGKPILSVTNLSTDVTKAEIIWGLKVASTDMSYRSCDKIGQTFNAMFNCPISRDFQLSRTKVSYMISDGFGPYFSKQLIYDVNRSKSPLTIHYDETTTSQVKKQMDLHFRYWSPTENEVVRRFYSALFFWHAEGEKVGNSIISKLEEDKVDTKSILTLSSDGPNVNKTIFRTVNKALKESGNPGMMNIGTCNLHVVHNSFCKALEDFHAPVDELAVDIHSFFKYSAARREDFKFAQLEEDVETHTFLRHVPSRWLTLGVVIDRLIEQWEPLEKYFMDLAKKDASNAPKSAAFKRICTRIQQKQTIVELHFLKSVMPVFHSFLELFQTEAPLIHILYDEMNRLVSAMMGRYVKVEVLKDKTGKSLKDIKHTEISNQLSDIDIVIGESTRSLMKKLDHGERKRVFLGVRKFYGTAVQYLLSHFPFESDLLENLGCLQPAKRTDTSSIVAIEQIARELPMIESDKVTLVVDEWKMLMNEDISESMWKEETDGEVKYRRIDHYWRDCLDIKTGTGKVKYANLSTVVRASLVLPHGNADVERGLSDNKRLVSKERVRLSEKSIVGNRLARDAVKNCDPINMQPESIPITKEMFSFIRSSHLKYQERIEEEKREKEREKRQKEEEREQRKEIERNKTALNKEKETLKEKTKKLDDLEKTYKKDLKVAEDLLSEANEKLAKALKKKDMHAASVSQAMLETAQNKMKNANKKLSEVRTDQKNVESRKRSNIEKLQKVGEPKRSKTQ